MSNLHQSVVTALPYAMLLAEEGIRLSLPANSDFVPLVRAASPFGGCVEGTTTENFLNRVAENSEVSYGHNEYEEITGGLKTSLADLVRNHIRTSQKVASHVVDGVERVRSFIGNMSDTSALGRFSIVEDPLCDVFEESYVQELVSSHVPHPRKLTSILCTRPRTTDELTAMLARCDKDFFQGLMRAASFFGLNEYGRPRHVLEEIFASFFCGVTPQTANYNMSQIGKLPAGERLFVALVLFHLAEALVEDVPQDAFGSLKEFEANCRSMMDLSRNLAVGAWDEKKNAIKNNLVILIPHLDQTTMVVDKTVYTAFLEAGGLPEVILGAKVGFLNHYTVEDLSANAEQCIRAWNQFASLNNATADNEARSFLRAAYKAIWAEMGSEYLEFEKEVRETNPKLFGSMTTEASTYIDSLTIEQLQKPEEVMEKLIAGIRFGYTPASIFLREMRRNRASSNTKNETAEVGAREDALVATIKYLTLYVVSQIAVVRV